MGGGGKSVNYYEILGCTQESSQKEILKAYRKKALTCHPDKNPDNPKAADLFIELSEAFKILTDSEAKAAFDKVLAAKEKARLRTKAFDVKRKKFKEDLEKRENAAQQEKEIDIDAAEKLAAEIKRLREEGSRLLKEQQEIIEKQLKEDAKNKATTTNEDLLPKLKVKWKAKKTDHDNGGYDENILKEIFQQFGVVTAVVISVKKNGLAIIEYAKPSHARVAIEFAKGLEDNPLTVVTWLVEPSASQETPCEEKVADKKETTIPEPQQPLEPQRVLNPSYEEDFEAMVLKRMKQAEERKRLNQELQDEEAFTSAT
ncbi:dnaJ homolog subfamily C member 17-like [Clytia hemisphaerica]|uniref:J domain-containing protein n=1 Tax=Clytia hemisphaerica TaxID=252671 RepID=A0A7M5V3E6_9CNID|eukprot:TCONS_00015668-protein